MGSNLNFFSVSESIPQNSRFNALVLPAHLVLPVPASPTITAFTSRRSWICSSCRRSSQYSLTAFIPRDTIAAGGWRKGLGSNLVRFKFANQSRYLDSQLGSVPSSPHALTNKFSRGIYGSGSGITGYAQDMRSVLVGRTRT